MTEEKYQNLPTEEVERQRDYHNGRILSYSTGMFISALLGLSTSYVMDLERVMAFDAPPIYKEHKTLASQREDVANKYIIDFVMAANPQDETATWGDYREAAWAGRGNLLKVMDQRIQEIEGTSEYGNFVDIISSRKGFLDKIGVVFTGGCSLLLLPLGYHGFRFRGYKNELRRKQQNTQEPQQ